MCWTEPVRSAKRMVRMRFSPSACVKSCARNAAGKPCCRVVNWVSRAGGCAGVAGVPARAVPQSPQKRLPGGLFAP